MNIKVRYFSATDSTFNGDLELIETCAIIRYVDKKTYNRMTVIIPLSSIWQIVTEEYTP